MKFNKEQFIGRVSGLYNSKYPNLDYTGIDYFFTEKRNPLSFGLEGILNERHSGFTFPSDSRMKNLYEKGTPVRFNRQWLAVSEFELQSIQKNLNINEKILPEHIGANLMINTTEHLSKLPMMSHLVFSKHNSLKYKDPENVVLVSYAEVKPCTIAAKGISNELDIQKISSEFVKASNDLRGLTGWIEKGGEVHEGDYVFLLMPKGY